MAFTILKNNSLLGKLVSFIKKDSSSIEDSVNKLIEERKQNGTEINEKEQELLHNLLESYESTVQEVMTPRKYIKAFDYHLTVDEIKQFIIDNEHTRIPVYKDHLDNVLGFIHIRDFIKYLVDDGNIKIDHMIRNIIYVPQSMKIVDLISHMRISGTQIAIVMDEYGGVDGLITMEDLLEKIVGEIRDEYGSRSKVQPYIITSNNKDFVASANINIRTIEQKLNVKFLPENEEVDYDTLGGLICDLAGRVPQVGEKITHNEVDISFAILESDPRHIKTVKIAANCQEQDTEEKTSPVTDSEQ